MSKNTKQYTVRNIPLYVDKILRQRARDSNKTFNQVILEAILLGSEQNFTLPKRDLSAIVGSLSEIEANAIEEEIRNQRQIDEDLWK